MFLVGLSVNMLWISCMENETVSVTTEIQDRKAQREKLAQFFRENPSTAWSQETLALNCGADVGAVRTRISELRRDDWWRERLRFHSGSYPDKDGTMHRGKKLWEFIPRPAESLGRDAGTPVPQRSLFPLSPLS